MSEPWPPVPVPPIPPEIKQAADEANLVIFVGAGVSRLMGCPSWEELAQECLLQLAQKELITFGDVEQLSHLDAKKKLTIAIQIAQAEGKPLDLPNLVQPDKLRDSQVYDHLHKIGCACVTTNYDRFLDRAPLRTADPAPTDSTTESPSVRELICRPNQFTPQCLRAPGAVVHLHGSVDEPDSMVITTPGYLEHYEDECIRTFLAELFDRYTVLFVGYGLDEWEILEHILRKGRFPSRPQASRFMLSGYLSHQQKTFEHLRNYYKEYFGIVLLPFSRDRHDHAQLEHILEDWSGRLKIGDPLLADDLAFLLEVAGE